MFTQCAIVIRMVQLHIATNIRAEMARRKLTQQDLAQVLGITRQAVSQRLLGRTPFRVDELVRIAELLDIPTSELLAS